MSPRSGPEQPTQQCICAKPSRDWPQAAIPSGSASGRPRKRGPPAAAANASRSHLKKKTPLLSVLVKPAEIALQQTFPSQSHNEAVVAPGSARRKSQKLFVVLVFVPAIVTLQEFEAFESGMISCFFLKASHSASGVHRPPLSILNCLRFRSFSPARRSLAIGPTCCPFLRASRCSSGGQHPWSAQLRKSRSFNTLKSLTNLHQAERRSAI
jgi:hypothetical protein